MSAGAPRPDVAGFLAYLKEQAAPPLSTLSVTAARLVMRANCAVADAPPVPLARIEDGTVPGEKGTIPVRLYDRRLARAAGPLILFFHGGGFVMGDVDTHHSFCSWLADMLDLPLLSVGYRLAPENPFPAAIEDAETVARWVALSLDLFGFSVTGLIPCGDSAGGSLAIVVTQLLAVRPAAVPVQACWALYPYVGGGSNWPSYRTLGDGFFLSTKDMAWFDSHYDAPNADARHDCLIGPVPPVPLLLHVAELDPLRDAACAYADRVEKAGYPVQRLEAVGMIHGFINFRQALPSAQQDCAAFAAAAKAMLENLQSDRSRAAGQA